MVRKENKNIKIKRILAAVLSLAMGVSMMTACGSSDSSSKAENDSSATENTQKHTNDPMTVTTAKDLVAQMKVGWNLGNTMDATGGSGIDAETSWGNVETTKLMIDQVKDAGFNVFRLPVSWGTHMDENYTVDEAWMNRVQEIVDYGIDNGMFVILNTHHEEWYMPKKDRADKDIEQLKALWKQICDRFQGYDEHLIFEGVNEPRLRGEGNEWIGDAESREVVNQYAKAFVETKRDNDGLLSAEDAASYAEMEQKIKDYGAEIERMEQMAAMDAQLSKPTSAPSTRIAYTIFMTSISAPPYQTFRPEKPMNARAMRPAVIRAMGKLSQHLG